MADESECMSDPERENVDRVYFEQNATGAFDDELDLYGLYLRR